MIKACLPYTLLCLLTCPLVGSVASARTIEFETTQVTSPDVALSPDGDWLVFTMLGHLFRLPVKGGTAEQLTFGPYYDTDPAASPDGRRVAFVSDRDGSEGNVFMLELANGEITQITRESWVARPTWSPDGRSLVYLLLLPPDAPSVAQQPRFSVPESVPTLVRLVSSGGGHARTLSGEPQLIRSVFYLPDGRLAWTLVELSVELQGGWWRGSAHARTRIEVMNTEGAVTTLATVEGYAAPAVPSPAGDGLYIRRFRPVIPWHRRPAEDLLFLPLPEGGARLIVPLARPRGWTPRFAVSDDNERLYVGAAGRLWEIALPNGAREPIPFRAKVKLEIRDPVPPPRLEWPSAGSAAPPRSVTFPRLSPDGRALVFAAARLLWRQRLDGGGRARRLFEGSAIEGEPAFSPDGRRLAFTHRAHGRQELRVLEFASGQIRTLASESPGRWRPSWSPDGQRLAFATQRGVMVVELDDGKTQKLTEAAGWRPHFTAGGRALYYLAAPTGTAQLYRLSLDEGAQPEPMTELASPLSDGLVSPDGKWLAFRRGLEIWLAPFGAEPIGGENARRLSREGGYFAFTPDASALIYSTGNRVWRQPLGGGEREEIPVRLELPRPTPRPLLLRRVRVLDYSRGGFGPETSLLIERGRIRWIGDEKGRSLPPERVTLDAGGRFAIPGLFDMHVHRAWARPETFLAYGVTSVRDMGASLPQLSALADRSEATSDPLPRYFYPGEVLGSWLIHSEDDARSIVRLWKEGGAHFIKIYTWEEHALSWPLQRTVVEEARRLRLPVVGHGTDVEEITKSVTLGFSMLEHTPSPPPYGDVLTMLAEAGTRWDPTLAMYGGNSLLLRDEPERLADPKLRAFIPLWQIRDAQAGGLWWSLGDGELRGQWEQELASIRAAHRTGVKLQIGTDSGSRLLGGPSIGWELEYFVRAGLTPLEAIRIATQEAATALGAEDDLGTLQPGKLADMVLLDANPLEDIRNTQTIWRVIKGGWLFDPEKLRPPASDSDAQ